MQQYYFTIKIISFVVFLLCTKWAIAQPLPICINFVDMSMDQAVAEATREGKFIFIDFTTDFCGGCVRLEKEVFIDQELAIFFNKNFISIKINPKNPDDLERNRTLIEDKPTNVYPRLMFTRANGSYIDDVSGFIAAPNLLQKARAAVNNNNNTRQPQFASQAEPTAPQKPIAPKTAPPPPQYTPPKLVQPLTKAQPPQPTTAVSAGILADNEGSFKGVPKPVANTLPPTVPPPVAPPAKPAVVVAEPIEQLTAPPPRAVAPTPTLSTTSEQMERAYYAKSQHLPYEQEVNEYLRQANTTNIAEYSQFVLDFLDDVHGKPMQVLLDNIGFFKQKYGNHINKTIAGVLRQSLANAPSDERQAVLTQALSIVAKANLPNQSDLTFELRGIYCQTRQEWKAYFEMCKSYINDRRITDHKVLHDIANLLSEKIADPKILIQVAQWADKSVMTQPHWYNTYTTAQIYVQIGSMAVAQQYADQADQLAKTEMNDDDYQQFKITMDKKLADLTR